MGVLGTNLANFWTDNSHAVALCRIACVVVMVIGFSDGEMRWLFDGCDDVSIKQWLHFINHSSGSIALFSSCRHDATSVLSAYVVALAVELGWVVNGEEHFEEGVKRDNGGVEDDLNDFSMARGPRADWLVARVWIKSTGVGGKSGFNTMYSFEGAFRAPKASSA